ncbi:MAG: HPr family phosphocarrier protein [Bacteroidales bacterium]|nr:HPr family phosphocarrier protein [Clostridium sp.]MCM1203477.1 HPr family phosphocarrier protein [Bacteroidales bacterium]
MTSETVTVNLAADAEARPVAVLVQKASQFESKVYIQSGDKKINAKSIMGMMSLGLTQDKEVTVSAEGADESEAVENLTSYLQNAK